MNFLIYCLVSSIIFVSTATNSHAIRCDALLNETEKTICSNDDLIDYDEILNINYAKALNVAYDKKQLQDSQQKWISFRNEYTDVGKLKKIYKDRVKLLEGLSDLGVEKTMICTAQYGNQLASLSCNGIDYMFDSSHKLTRAVVDNCPNWSTCEVHAYFKEGAITSLISITKIQKPIVDFSIGPDHYYNDNDVLETKKITAIGEIKFSNYGAPHYYFDDGKHTYRLIFAFDDNNNVADTIADLSHTNKKYKIECTINVFMNGDIGMKENSKIKIYEYD